MVHLNYIGKMLITIGTVLIVVGVLMILFGKTGFPFGRLPGDIIIRKKNVVVYFPLVTSLILSVLISLILFLISKFK